uniref:Wall-associated receptor kinase galacturonan-binding domain-containing protein n=1 Tax=Musa acuminata subsp. malaccensis TaxID=214687 RepID=A0A804IXR4_MUSAM
MLLFLLASTSTGSIRTESRSTNTTFPLPLFCPKSCGNISFEYPFGIGDGCFRPGFNLTCRNHSTSAPRLFLGDGTIETSRNSYTGSTLNRLDVVGCSAMASLVDLTTNKTISTCFSLCAASDPSQYSEWSDVNSGYCTLDLDFNNTTALEIQLTRLNQRELHLVNTSGIKFIMFDADADDREGVLNGSRTNVEATLAWYMNDHLSCEEAINTDTYACVSQNSLCRDVMTETMYLSNSSGYLCQCSASYQGNPYVPNGCQGNFPPL